jgi:hypothetical protein
MSRLKRSIQTARISAHAHCTDRRGSFKRKRIFYAERGIVACPHILAGQASKKKGSMIVARPFAKNPEFPYAENCSVRRNRQERITGFE